MAYKWFCRLCKRSGTIEIPSSPLASAEHMAAMGSDELRNPYGSPKMLRNDPSHELLGNTECVGDLRITPEEPGHRVKFEDKTGVLGDDEPWL